MLRAAGSQEQWLAPPVIEGTFLDNPARYPRAVYRDLVLAFYNANYFHRKAYEPS